MEGKAPILVVVATLFVLGITHVLLPMDAATTQAVSAPAVTQAEADTVPPSMAGSMAIGLSGAGLIGLWLFNLRRRIARPRASGQWGHGFGPR